MLFMTPSYIKYILRGRSVVVRKAVLTGFHVPLILHQLCIAVELEIVAAVWGSINMGNMKRKVEKGKRREKI